MNNVLMVAHRCSFPISTSSCRASLNYLLSSPRCSETFSKASPIRLLYSICTSSHPPQRSTRTPAPLSPSVRTAWLRDSGLARPFHSTRPCLKKPTARQPKPMPRKPPLMRPGDRVVVPFGAISKESLHGIFGQDVDYVQGNEVLRMIQERRATGALIDKGVQPDFPTSIPADSLLKSLEWLRQKYPLDEKEAAERWAALEAARLEDEYIARAEKLGLYKPDLQSPSDVRDTSTSVLQEFQKFNEQKIIREEKQREESGEAQQSRELAVARQEEREKKLLEAQEASARRRERREREGKASQDTEMPELSDFQRLWRPTLFALVFLVSGSLVAETYKPVSQADRLFPNIPVAWTTVGAIVGANLLVFCMWRMPPLWRLLNTYAVLVPANPFAASIFCNTFSHQTVKHLAANMLGGVILFGIPVHEEIGRANFLYLYVAGGVIGSLSSLYYYVLASKFLVYTQGASGSVWALMATWAIFNSQKPAPLPNDSTFVWDITRWSVLVTGILGHFVPSVFATLDWMSHVGGVCIGLSLGFVYYMRTVIDRQHEAIAVSLSERRAKYSKQQDSEKKT